MKTIIEKNPTHYTPKFGHFFHAVNDDSVYIRLNPWIPKHFSPEQVEEENSVIHALCVSSTDPSMEELPLNGDYLPLALWNCNDGRMYFKPIDEFWRNDK